MRTDTPLRLSWRDPAGFVVHSGGRIFRAVHSSAVSTIDAVLGSGWYAKLMAEGAVAGAQWLDCPPAWMSDSADHRWLEHRMLPLPCYAHEITALQLHDAAKLTLRIAHEAAGAGWQLKDASAWNVLFTAGKPVFCDLLSFEPTDGSGIWRAYGQFCRHFVIPLLLHRRLGLQPAELFLVHRDGITPEIARPMLTGICAYLQPALETVTLPAALSKRGSEGPRLRRPPVARSAGLAANLLSRTLIRLDHHIDVLEPRYDRSRGPWTDYGDDRVHYTDADLLAKRDFVSTELSRPGIRRVLDLGCNAGEYSLLAAERGLSVIAADADHGALTKLYAVVCRQGLDVTPVVLDIARPTPAVGWMNAEIPAFIERMRGAVDCVLALGLLHHLLVTERAPLEMIRDLLAAFQASRLLVEWIEPRDPRFEQIAGFDPGLYAHLDRRYFERVFAEKYELIDACTLGGGARVLYSWQAKGV